MHPSTSPTGIPLSRDEDVRECTCGGQQPASCRVCPVCQLIAFVQQVSPDTIDRVADFVGFAATALRDLATAQRERTTAVPRDADDAHDPTTCATRATCTPTPALAARRHRLDGTGDVTGEDRA